VKIIAVCGMGIGTSVLLKLNAEKVLKMLDLEATVDAADVATVRKVSFDAQIILTTPDLVDQLQGLPAEIISIEHVFDLEELSTKLSKALL
jgi:PTS system ascorbate-specific IIB component